MMYTHVWLYALSFVVYCLSLSWLTHDQMRMYDVERIAKAQAEKISRRNIDNALIWYPKTTEVREISEIAAKSEVLQCHCR